MKIKHILLLLVSVGIFFTANLQAKQHEFENLWNHKSKNTISLLFVQQATTADLIPSSTPNCYQLVLNNVPNRLLYFTDQPNRFVGHIENMRLIQLWNRDKSVPNAVLDGKILQNGKLQTVNIVLVLTQPRFDEKQAKMYYQSCVTDVAAQTKRLPVKLTEINLFIDPFNDGGEV